jgi:hypothetical protein
LYEKPGVSTELIFFFTNRISYCKIFASHSCGYEKYHLLGHNAVYSVECQPTFWRNISPPSSGSKEQVQLETSAKAGGKQSLCLADLFLKRKQISSACHLLSHWFLAKLIFSTLKMEATCSSETSVDTQRNTRRYIPEDCTLRISYYPEDNNSVYHFSVLGSRWNLIIISI